MQGDFEPVCRECKVVIAKLEAMEGEWDHVFGKNLYDVEL